MTFTANELLTYILNCDAGLAGYDYNCLQVQKIDSCHGSYLPS